MSLGSTSGRDVNCTPWIPARSAPWMFSMRSSKKRVLLPAGSPIRSSSARKWRRPA